MLAVFVAVAQRLHAAVFSHNAQCFRTLDNLAADEGDIVKKGDVLLSHEVGMTIALLEFEVDGL